MVSVMGGPTTNYLDTLIPVGILESDHLGGCMSGRVVLGDGLVTLDSIHESCLGTLTLGDFGTSDSKTRSHGLPYRKSVFSNETS